MMDWTETLRLLVTVVALAVALTSLITRRRDRVLDAIKDMSERLTRVEARLEGLDKRLDGLEKRLDGLEKRLHGLEKRVGSIEVSIRSGQLT